MKLCTSGKITGAVISLLIGAMNVAVGTTWFVKQDAAGLMDGSSWANAFTNLDAGLAAAMPSDEVWVAGTTFESSNGDRLPPAGTIQAGRDRHG